MAKRLIHVTTIFYGDRKTVKSVYDSLHPDNIIVPDHIKVEEVLEGEEYKLVFKGELESKVINSIKQSVDEVLAITDMLFKSLAETRKQDC